MKGRNIECPGHAPGPFDQMVGSTYCDGSCVRGDDVKSARIVRERIYRSRFVTGPGPAWRYLYSAENATGRTILAGYDRLDSIEAELRRRGYTAARAWEGGAS